MREEDLRAVLLVKAIEELDREGTIIPRADRTAAARDAKREPQPADPLAQRAKALLAKIEVRHPFVRQVVSVTSGTPSLAWFAMLAGLFVGFSLSALDGTRRINVLAFPLLGLVLWNLVVYAALIAGWIKSPQSAAPLPRWLPSLAARAATSRVAALVSRSRAFNALLAEALARFLAEWQEAARPLILARASRILHLAAAAVGIGLIAGLYLRGIAFDYQAGWESTFLDPLRAHGVLTAIYGPASWATGIAIPDLTQLEAIRWRDGKGGGSAVDWIHLLAASAVLFVVLPRLALALGNTAFIARGSRNLAPPASLASYSRVAFSSVGGLVDRGIVMVVPFAYEPATNSLARLRALLGAEMGEHLAVDVRAPVPYGGEEAFLGDEAAQPGATADVIVMLFNLAATPEDENHGMMMTRLRDWVARNRPTAQLLAFMDEGPYAERMAGAPGRMEERRRAWQEFVAARGIEPRFVDLSR